MADWAAEAGTELQTLVDFGVIRNPTVEGKQRLLTVLPFICLEAIDGERRYQST